VCFVSEAFGGIADYTTFLLKALYEKSPVKIHIIWLANPENCQEEKISRTLPMTETILNLVIPSRFKEPLSEIILKLSHKIIHFQYETSFFPSNHHFLELLSNLHLQTTKKIVITLHSVKIDPPSIQMLKEGAKLVDMYIVHQENAKTFLVSKGIDPSKIIVIPHGTPIIHPYPKKIGFFKTDSFKIALVGFLRACKTYHKALSSIIYNHNLEIIVAGMMKNHTVLQQIKFLQRKANATFTLIPRYLSTSELLALIAEADCIILPYEQEYFSSSGILHLAASLHKPLLVSSSPKFKELTSKIPFCEVADGNYLKHIQIIQKPQVMDQISKRIAIFAKKTSWIGVAKKTCKLYQELLQSPNYYRKSLTK
jgi:glycosyltransferase involved in cell wall biosynthesis